MFSLKFGWLFLSNPMLKSIFPLFWGQMRQIPKWISPNLDDSKISMTKVYPPPQKKTPWLQKASGVAKVSFPKIYVNPSPDSKPALSHGMSQFYVSPQGTWPVTVAESTLEKCFPSSGILGKQGRQRGAGNLGIHSLEKIRAKRWYLVDSRFV